MAIKKQRKLTKLEQAGIAAVIIIAGVYLYSAKVYNPMMAKRKIMQNKCNSLDVELRKLKDSPLNTKVFASLRKCQEDHRDAKIRMEKARECIAKPEEVLPLRAKVMETAGAYKLRRQEVGGAVDGKAEAVAAPKGQFSIGNRSAHRIVLSGSFSNVVDFLDSLGKMEKRIWVENISISLRDEGSALTVSMLLRI